MSPAKIALGREVYNFRCYFCHGFSGDAKTVAAQQVRPPPRDFTATHLTEREVLAALDGGVSGTAMKSFKNVLSSAERDAVAAFVVDEFVQRGDRNTAYHTAANGWPDHDRHYAAAFPFVRGDVALDADPDAADAETRRGRRLFLDACITCHEPRSGRDLLTLESFPLSHMGEVVREVDAVSRASVYAIHDRPPQLAALSAQEQRGRHLYNENCAFCHAADGTGRNWIGSFLQPHPRNFLDPRESRHLNREHVKLAVREGLPNTSMPAWGGVLSEDDIDSVARYVDRVFLARMRASR